MTCIVALKTKAAILIGADSASVGGLDSRVSTVPKVFRVGDMLIGCTTSWRMIQLLQHGLTLPKHHADVETMAYMCTVFINAVRDCFRTGGFMTKDKETEYGGTFLVVYRERIFHVDGDYQVNESADGFDACGCGESYALGSLHATAQQDDGRARLQLALETAAHFSAGVRGPFTVLEAAI